MKNVMKLTVSAVALSGGVLLAAPAMAQSGPSVSGNFALTSDYRFRGVSLSDEDVAVQGGIDLGWDSGFYLGTWGSSIASYAGSEAEVDLYTGFGGDLGNGLGYDIGVIGYFYPGSDPFGDTWYGEIYASLGGEVDMFGWTVGGAYAPDQDNIGGTDNVYLFADASVGLGDSPFSLDGHFGWEDGAFGDDKLDWSLGISASAAGLDFGLAWIDTDVQAETADSTFVFTIGSSW
mgnify:CR=1 FL=1